MVTTLVKRCIEKKMTLAVAESCTGGLLGSKIVDVPGASQVFKGGVLCYADEVKRNLLNVPDVVREDEGAVSGACAEAMVQGVRKLLDVDLAVSITGIAGPSGGTDEKPVGLVYICAATEDAVLSQGFKFEGARSEIREQAVNAALTMLLKVI